MERLHIMPVAADVAVVLLPTLGVRVQVDWVVAVQVHQQLPVMVLPAV
jgi:hypothetical protein